MLRITDDKGTLVPNAAIKGFTLSESINSMFVIARLDIEDTNSVVSNGLSIGQRYKVSMEDEESSLTQDMRVLKFSKTPVEGEYSTSTVTITLISDWYFTSRFVILTRSLKFRSTLEKLKENAESCSIKSLLLIKI